MQGPKTMKLKKCHYNVTVRYSKRETDDPFQLKLLPIL